MDFAGNTLARLEGSVHSQLTDFCFKPGGGPATGFSFGFLKSKDTIDKCATLEEFLAKVIKDKPANIDRFFDSYVKSVFESCASLTAYISQAISEADGRPETKEIADSLREALASCHLSFTDDFKAFVKTKAADLKPQEGEEVTFFTGGRSESIVYRSMNFRDFYNSIERLPKCHSVIENELAFLSARSISLWKLLGLVILQLSGTVMKTLRSEHYKRTEDMFLLMTQTKNVEDDQLCKEIEHNLEKMHKEDAESKLKQEHFKSCIREFQPKSSTDYIEEDSSDLPLFYEDIVRIPKNTSPANLLDGPPLKVEEQPVKEEGSEEGRTLIILVHGVQGNHSDMIPVEEKIHEYLPSAIVFQSKANEGDHQCELYLMGRRLAEEVADEYKAISKSLRINRISFVAFSTGRRC